MVNRSTQADETPGLRSRFSFYTGPIGGTKKAKRPQTKTKQQPRARTAAPTPSAPSVMAQDAGLFWPQGPESSRLSNFTSRSAQPQVRPQAQPRPALAPERAAPQRQSIAQPDFPLLLGGRNPIGQSAGGNPALFSAYQQRLDDRRNNARQMLTETAGMRAPQQLAPMQLRGAGLAARGGIGALGRMQGIPMQQPRFGRGMGLAQAVQQARQNSLSPEERAMNRALMFGNTDQIFNFLTNREQLGLGRQQLAQQGRAGRRQHGLDRRRLAQEGELAREGNLLQRDVLKQDKKLAKGNREVQRELGLGQIEVDREGNAGRNFAATIAAMAEMQEQELQRKAIEEGILGNVTPKDRLDAMGRLMESGQATPQNMQQLQQFGGEDAGATGGAMSPGLLAPPEQPQPGEDPGRYFNELLQQLVNAGVQGPELQQQLRAAGLSDEMAQQLYDEQSPGNFEQFMDNWAYPAVHAQSPLSWAFGDRSKRNRNRERKYAPWERLQESYNLQQ